MTALTTLSNGLPVVDGLIGVLKRSGEASRFVTLMELTGITQQLQRMHEFTIFIPSNDAVQVRRLFFLSITDDIQS